jgi:hypothetical protein
MLEVHLFSSDLPMATADSDNNSALRGGAVTASAESRLF